MAALDGLFVKPPRSSTTNISSVDVLLAARLNLDRIKTDLEARRLRFAFTSHVPTVKHGKHVWTRSFFPEQIVTSRVFSNTTSIIPAHLADSKTVSQLVGRARAMKTRVTTGSEPLLFCPVINSVPSSFEACAKSASVYGFVRSTLGANKYYMLETIIPPTSTHSTAPLLTSTCRIHPIDYTTQTIRHSDDYKTWKEQEDPLYCPGGIYPPSGHLYSTKTDSKYATNANVIRLGICGPMVIETAGAAPPRYVMAYLTLDMTIGGWIRIAPPTAWSSTIYGAILYDNVPRLPSARGFGAVVEPQLHIGCMGNSHNAPTDILTYTIRFKGGVDPVKTLTSINNKVEYEIQVTSYTLSYAMQLNRLPATVDKEPLWRFTTKAYNDHRFEQGPLSRLRPDVMNVKYAVSEWMSVDIQPISGMSSELEVAMGKVKRYACSNEMEILLATNTVGGDTVLGEEAKSVVKTARAATFCYETSKTAKDVKTALGANFAMIYCTGGLDSPKPNFAYDEYCLENGNVIIDKTSGYYANKSYKEFLNTQCTLPSLTQTLMDERMNVCGCFITTEFRKKIIDTLPSKMATNLALRCFYSACGAARVNDNGTASTSCGDINVVNCSSSVTVTGRDNLDVVTGGNMDCTISDTKTNNGTTNSTNNNTINDTSNTGGTQPPPDDNGSKPPGDDNGSKPPGDDGSKPPEDTKVSPYVIGGSILGAVIVLIIVIALVSGKPQDPSAELER